MEAARAQLVESIRAQERAAAALQSELAEQKAQLALRKHDTHSLSAEKRKLKQALVSLHVTLEQDEEYISNSLLKKITARETEIHQLELKGVHSVQAQEQLEVLHKEKIALEKLLDQECEAVVNKLTREKAKLESDKIQLQRQLEHCPAHAELIRQLADEVLSLRQLLASTTRKKRIAEQTEEIAKLKKENSVLQREFGKALTHLEKLEHNKAKLESDAEIDEERTFNLSRSASPAIMVSPHTPLKAPGLNSSPSSARSIHSPFYPAFHSSPSPSSFRGLPPLSPSFNRRVSDSMALTKARADALNRSGSSQKEGAA
eukprot:m.62484 g.62484  ORF g.62484 m.62484 type:complete len:317 (+) comp49566_c0_seq1:78-1028(+)